MAEEDRGAFIWYELMTPNPASAKIFYDAVVGWDIDAGNSAPGGNSDYRMIKRPDGGFAGGVLALTAEMIAGGAKPGWFGYVHVPDVDAAAQTVLEAGGAISMAPHDMEGVGRMAMVADPQGAAIYLMTPAPPADEPEAKSDVYAFDKPQHVRWNELQTSDPEAAVALYTGLFGWDQKERMPMGEMGDYLFIHRGAEMIGAIMPGPAEASRAAWAFYIGVDDIDRAAQAATDGGGKLEGEIIQIPGGHYSVHCSDPHGAKFGLVGPRKE